MRRAWLLIPLALALGLPTDSEAGRRRQNGRMSKAQVGQNLPFSLTLGTPLELFSADDRDNSGAFYRTYRNAPSVAIAPDGEIVSVHRAAASHATADDAVVIVRNQRGYGLSWDDRRTEVTYSNNASVQEFAAISTIGTRMWMIGTDATLSGSTPRECWTAYSDDDGVTWTSPDATRVRAATHVSKTYNIPRPGSHFTTCVNTGIYEADDGDLVSVIYWNDTSQTRYIAGMIRSTDGGVNWTVSATIADMGSLGTQLQFEEPGCLRVPDTATHICLLRVDNGPNPSVLDPNTGEIMLSRSTDDGATWSTPTYVFDGRGTPAIIRLTNGVLVATTRGRGQTVGSDTTGFRGLIYYSTDSGATWRSGGEFQNPIDGPDEMYGGSYQGAALVEVRPNVAGVMHTQEVTATANTNSGVFWSEISFNEATPITFDYSASALMFPSDGSADLNMGTNDILNGASAATLSFWFRKEYRSGVPWVAADEVVIARNNTGQRHFDVRFLTTRRLQILLGATLSTLATWTSNNNMDQLNNSQRTVLTIVYDGSGSTNAERLRIYADGTEITSSGTFSGTVPATLTSPTTASWYIGSQNGSSRLRSTALDTLAIWPGVVARPEDAISLWSGGIPIEVGTTLLGPPAVLHQFEGSTANTGTDTSWAVSAQTGTFTYRTRSYSRRHSQRPPFGNIAGARRASGGTYINQSVASGSALDSQDKTVCAWAAIDANHVDYDGLGWRQAGGGVGEEPFYLLMDPLGDPGGANNPAFASCDQTWTFGIGQQGHGVGAACGSLATDLTGQFVCGRYAHSDTATIGDGAVFVNGVDATLRYSTGLAVPATPNNDVPPTIAPITTDMRAVGIRSGTGLGSMDTLMYFNCPLTDDEILAIYCATVTQSVAACQNVTVNAYTAITGHACYVDMWSFDNASDLGASRSGLRDFGGTANAETAPALP